MTIKTFALNLIYLIVNYYPKCNEDMDDNATTVIKTEDECEDHVVSEKNHDEDNDDFVPMDLTTKEDVKQEDVVKEDEVRQQEKPDTTTFHNVNGESSFKNGSNYQKIFNLNIL